MRAALIDRKKTVVSMWTFSPVATAIKFGASAPIIGHVQVRVGCATNMFPTGDAFRIHPFGMGEWKSSDGGYLRILDMQDGTSVIHAPFVGLHFKQLPYPLSRAPFPAPLPKNLEAMTRKAMTLQGACSTCGDGSGGGAVPDPGSTWYDPYGDSLTNLGDNTLEVDAGGDNSAPWAFDPSVVWADFGTNMLTWDMANYPTIHSPNPMTDECRRALSDLNKAFLMFVGLAFGVGALLLAGAKLKVGGPRPGNGIPASPNDGFSDFSASFGDPAQFIAALIDLQEKQNTVDSACAGQGAGRRPYG